MAINDLCVQQELELELFEIFKDEINVVVDIGCRENNEYSLINPNAKMYLFDTNEYFIDRLNEKVKDNKNIFTFPFGLSNKNAEVQYSPNSESIQEHRYFLNPNELTLVKIRKFDEVMDEIGITDKIDFLKIDIEGSEPEILEHVDIIKNIKFVQFEFGRAWPNLNEYNLWSVIEQYKDSHKCYYLKDPHHSIVADYPDIDILTYINKEFHDELHRRLVNGLWGEGGNVWMIRNDIVIDE